MSLLQRVVQLVKWAVALLLDLTGVLAWLRRRRVRRGEVAVLWLHRVDGRPDARVPMGVPPEVFRELTLELAERYRIGSWTECVEAAEAKSGPPMVAVTFDDGYRDNYTHAWPLLRAVGGRGVFFVTTDFIDGEALWWERVASVFCDDGEYPVDGKGEATYGEGPEELISALKEARNRDRLATVVELESKGMKRVPPPAFSWSEAREMSAEGALFGGHTRSHPVLTRCDPDELPAELSEARARTEREVGEAVTLFAYPNGSHDDGVVEATRRAGYDFAFTTEKGVYTAETDPFRIPRIGVSEPKYSLDGRGFSWRLFEAEMLGVFDVLLGRRWRR